MSIVDFSQIEFGGDLVKAKFKIYNIVWYKGLERSFLHFDMVRYQAQKKDFDDEAIGMILHELAACFAAGTRSIRRSEQPCRNCPCCILISQSLGN